MLKAESAGKCPKIEKYEDIITSDVFGLISCLDRRTIWKGVAKKLGMGLSIEEAENTVFEFWPERQTGVEPDLVIYAGRYIIVVECKYKTGFKKDQIVRETKRGLKLLEKSTVHDMLVVLGVATDLFEPGFFEGLREQFKLKEVRYKYIRWQQIRVYLEGMASNSDQVTTRFIGDLSQVLDRRDILSYSGFDIKEIRKIRDATKPAHSMIRNLGSLQGDLLAALDQHNIDSQYPGKWHDENFNTTAFKWPAMPGFAMLDFRSSEWSSLISWRRRCLYVKLMLAVETGKLWVGYYYRVWNSGDRELLKSCTKEIKAFAKEYPASIIVQRDDKLRRKSRLEFEKVTPGAIVSEGFLDNVTFIEVFRRMDAEAGVSEIAQTLIDTTEFVNLAEFVPLSD
jgi:hypothetical protein